MKILHCCLSCFYIDGYNYQENMLPRQNKLDGHEVLIIASTETYVDNTTLGYINSGEYVNEDGIRVIRVPYKKTINNTITHKIRAYKGVYQIIEEFAPDIILFHGMAAWELLTMVRYVRNHEATLYIDSHESFENSARNMLSFYVLHKIIYKSILKKAMSVVEKFLYIGLGESKFITEMYAIPLEKQEYYPLGGSIMEPQEYSERRNRIRNALKIPEEDILFVHSGKMDAGKRTPELLRAFHKVKDDKFHLLVAGSLSDDVKEEVLESVQRDDRIRYLGWKSGEELLDLLCAADVYLQPGTVSATLQNAMCCECAIMAQPIPDYKYLLGDDGLYVQNGSDIEKVLGKISQNKSAVRELKSKTLNRAKELLDYKKLAARLYQKHI